LYGIAEREEWHSASAAEQDIIKDHPQSPGPFPYRNRWFVPAKTSFSGLNSYCMVITQQTTQGFATDQRVTTAKGTARESKSALMLLTEQGKPVLGASRTGMGTWEHWGALTKSQRTLQRREIQGTACNIIYFSPISDLQHHRENCFKNCPHN